MRGSLATEAPRSSSALAVIGTIATVLLIIGGLNWGLVGLFNFDLVATVFGPLSPLSRLVYGLVGLAALIAIFTLPRVARTR
jgi:uncharacterized membrane protein YuzA (DUF378 family)